MAEKDTTNSLSVSQKEESLLKILRGIGFGEVVFHVADGQPVRAEEIKKSIKL